MKSVLMIGSEAVPFAKTGGLADVLGALPLSLARLGWDVTLVMPRYRGIAAPQEIDRTTIAIGPERFDVGFCVKPLDANRSNARAVLIDCPRLYDRSGVYGDDHNDYPDNALRFALLSRGALEFSARQGVRPTVVHAHDWQAGLAPVYLKSIYASNPVLGGAPTVFTIHNLAYQGLFEATWAPRLDLPASFMSSDGLEFWGQVSLLKAGINGSEAVTTVSARYAHEIQTPEFGFGFEGVLQRRSSVLSGILNGVDVDQWNPERDPHLPASYTAADLSGKKRAKTALLERLGLTNDARPLIGMISRMVDQKGLDLIAALAAELPVLGATFAILGTGEPKYQDFWRGLAARYPDRIGVYVGFDESLAHLIEGGADIFMMPSRFEPCGLNQMYSLRYGTVPVVREVGGLADTVQDGVTGFVFQKYTSEALLQTLRRAVEAFGDQPKWRALQQAGMRQDHSWDRSAREYVTIYEKVGRWAAG